MTMHLTNPEPVVYHVVLDQDFKHAIRAGESPALQWALGFFFFGLPLMQNVLYAAQSIFKGQAPSGTDALLSLLGVIGIGIGATKYVEYRINRKTTESAIDKLEKRPREVTVTFKPETISK